MSSASAIMHVIKKSETTLGETYRQLARRTRSSSP